MFMNLLFSKPDVTQLYFEKQSFNKNYIYTLCLQLKKNPKKKNRLKVDFHTRIL